MNIKTSAGLLVGLALAIVAPAFAEEGFSGTGTAQGGTNSYYIVPRHGGIAHVLFVNGRVTFSDNTNGCDLVWYNAEPARSLMRAGVSGTNTLYLSSSNGMVIGDVIILTRARESLYERHTVSAVTSTNVTITGTTAGATVVGDTVYRMTVAGRRTHLSITAAPAVLDLPPHGGPYFLGIDGRPSLIELQGTQTNVLKAVTGLWMSRQPQ